MKVVFSFVGVEKCIDFTINVRKLIDVIVKEEKRKLGEISIVFTTNQQILEINKRFLKHSYYTDVITFDDNKREMLSGEIFISVDQVKINALKYNTALLDEIKRVIVHGILHLVGYEDRTEEQRIAMRNREDKYLCGFN